MNVSKKKQAQTRKILNIIVQHREVNVTNAPSTSSSSKTRFFVLLKFSNWNILQIYRYNYKPGLWSKFFRSSPTYSKGEKVLGNILNTSSLANRVDC